ncbi:peroxiredoxin [Methylobacillus gramineus]|uniref:peroxiredoxin n=1 Tax=Methylobacillus gramineus TaxID=755169 RepID=UPI001CFF5CF9|nr:peroxiredoxin [Methylobacillus gramineus]MCB5184831.1 peroxiredoxin [Methylobacillus gramineus]
MLQQNTQAPDFTLPDADMQSISLSELRDSIVVLYFYPKDDTPGCTLEAIEFSDLEDEFVSHNTIVLGISRDDCISHADFRDKHGLAVSLLSDVDGEVCHQYGVWQEKEKDGIKKMGIVRSTFVIDTAGMVRLAQYGVTAKGHAVAILNFIKSF